MMGLRKDYPVFLNNIEIPFGSSWGETSDVVENTMESEAGTTLRVVIRNDKQTIGYSVRVLEGMAKTLKSLSKEPLLTLRKFNIETGEYEERTVCIRSFNMDLVSGAEDLTAVNGVWDVSFTMEEV